MKKKVVALILCLVMGVTALVGCGQKSTPESSAGKKETGSSVAKTEEKESTPQKEEKELVDLRLVVFYVTPTDRLTEFMENDFHDRVLEELNIDLTVEFRPGSEMQMIKTAIASGEALALMNGLDPDGVSKGYYASIDEAMVQELMPDYLEMRGNKGLEFAKVDGKVYLLPMGNKPNAGYGVFQIARNDILKEVGWDADDITSYDKLMEAIAAVKEKYPNMGVMGNPTNLWNIANDEISDQWHNSYRVLTDFVYVDESADDDKIYSRYESEAFQNLCKITADWYEKGYITDSFLADPTSPTTEWNMGNMLFINGSSTSLIERNPVYNNVPDAELKLVKFNEAPLMMTTNYDMGLSISAGDAENVDRWLEFVNWLYQDKETYTFAVWGEEGVDYKITENDRIEVLTGEKLPAWWLEAASLHTYGGHVTDEALADYKANDDGAKISKTAGFVFDSTPVSTELALLTAVKDEYVWPMLYGILDYEENYDDVIKRLKDAGIDKYVEEFQRQFSEWYKTK